MAQKNRIIRPFAFFLNTKGVDQDAGTFSIQPDAADTIENLHMDALGQWSVNNQGYANFTAQQESGARIDALGWYTDATGIDYFLTVVNGKIKSVNTTGGSILATPSTAFTAGDPVDFETFNGKCYAVSKSLTPQKWSGSGSFAASGGWPITNGGDTYDKPIIVEKFSNRLVFANFNGAAKFPSHVAVSNNLDGETFTLTVGTDTNGAVFQVAPGDGQAVTAMKTLNIPASNEAILVIAKDRSIYQLKGNSQSTFNLTLVNPSIGCLNNRCMVQVGNDLLFLDQKNIYSFTTANYSGTIQPRAIGTRKVKNILASLNLSSRDKAWACHLPERFEVWFGIPTGSNTECDTILVYNYRSLETPQGEQPANAWSVRLGTKQTCGLQLNKTFFTGDTSGFVNKWFSASLYGALGINWKYRFPFHNFGVQSQLKCVRELYAWFQVNSNNTVTVQTEWQGGGAPSVSAKSIPVNVPVNSGSTYGTAIYGTGIYRDSLYLKKVRIPVIGNGEMFRFMVSGLSGAIGITFLGISGLIEVMGYSRTSK